jgi:hypothetical protein
MALRPELQLPFYFDELLHDVHVLELAAHRIEEWFAGKPHCSMRH